MKNKIPAQIKTAVAFCAGIAVVCFAALLSGCGTLSNSGPQAAPTAFEKDFYTVQTNVSIGPIVTLSNGVPVGTNQEYKTNYILTPGPGALATEQTAGAVGNIFGVGGIISTVLGGLFGLYGTLRSRQATATAGVLAQTVETARAVIGATPQGAQLNSALKSWMMEHQTDAGAIQAIAGLVDNFVDPEAATGAATSIVNTLLGTAQGNGPVAPTVPPAAAGLV